MLKTGYISIIGKNWLGNYEASLANSTELSSERWFVIRDEASGRFECSFVKIIFREDFTYEFVY